MDKKPPFPPKKGEKHQCPPGKKAPPPFQKGKK